MTATSPYLNHHPVRTEREAVLEAEKLWQTGLMFSSAEDANRVTALRHAALSKAEGREGES